MKLIKSCARGKSRQTAPKTLTAIIHKALFTSAEKSTYLVHDLTIFGFHLWFDAWGKALSNVIIEAGPLGKSSALSDRKKGID